MHDAGGCHCCTAKWPFPCCWAGLSMGSPGAAQSRSCPCCREVSQMHRFGRGALPTFWNALDGQALPCLASHCCHLLHTGGLQSEAHALSHAHTCNMLLCSAHAPSTCCCNQNMALLPLQASQPACQAVQSAVNPPHVRGTPPCQTGARSPGRPVLRWMTWAVTGSSACRAALVRCGLALCRHPRAFRWHAAHLHEAFVADLQPFSRSHACCSRLVQGHPAAPCVLRTARLVVSCLICMLSFMHTMDPLQAKCHHSACDCRTLHDALWRAAEVMRSTRITGQRRGASGRV